MPSTGTKLVGKHPALDAGSLGSTPGSPTMIMMTTDEWLMDNRTSVWNLICDWDIDKHERGLVVVKPPWSSSIGNGYYPVPLNWDWIGVITLEG